MSELSPDERMLKAIADHTAYGSIVDFDEVSDFMYKIVANMRQFGGSFVKSLAACYDAADPFNKRRLLSAFFEYFIKYTPEKWRTQKATEVA